MMSGMYGRLLVLLLAALLALPASAAAQPAVDEYVLDRSEFGSAAADKPAEARTASAGGGSSVPAMLAAIVVLATICVAVTAWRMHRGAEGAGAADRRDSRR
jgi:hypothetical protein